jgi:ABC-type glycerol-3-phosphate transport system substrate-binding protein
MQNDPAFNEDDYYMNVFEGMAYKGKLIVFPAYFSYSLIGVNNKFSAELVERFKQYNNISCRQLFDLYNSLDDKDGRYLCSNIDVITAVLDNLNAFVDFENKKCSFNTPEFIQFITDAKNVTPPQKKASGLLGMWAMRPLSRVDQEAFATQYLFADAGSTLYPVLMPYAEERAFTHYIPVAHDNGKLMLIPQKRLCISEASKNKELAWEFVKFLTTPAANENMLPISFPVHRGLFKESIPDNIAQFIKFEGNTIEEGKEAEAVEQVMALLEVYNEMPMERQLELDNEIARDTLTYFYNGELTAEQAATALQNKVSLYFME